MKYIVFMITFIIALSEILVYSNCGIKLAWVLGSFYSILGIFVYLIKNKAF